MIDMNTHIRQSKAQKESMDWADLAPELVLEVPDIGRVVLVIDLVRDELYRLVTQAIIRFHPTQVMLCADSYYEVAPPGTKPGDVTHGGRRERFLAGDPTVKEALSLVAYDGVELVQRILPYDAERRLWLLPAPFGPGIELQGVTADVLVKGWETGYLGWLESRR